ncbi:MAG: class I SAM-dependent methyltransferase [Rhodobacter sp.]|nr:class I SAM-dependent methyltransferase [Rhodobacter sp.]
MTEHLASTRREVTYSSTHRAEIEDFPIADIDRSAEFSDLFARTRNYTMTSKEIMFSTYQAARYVAERGIPGDIVECGVWRGGSALLAGLAVRAAEIRRPRRKWLASRRRRLWLYDTFEGMTVPTDQDVDLTGTSAAQYMAEHSDEGRWCYADEADVRQVLASEGFGPKDVEIVRGDVAKTLRASRPRRIALLRLDTDWYESTKAELELLFPRLSRGGVLIIDDYGHWEGARQAVDEFFAREPGLLLNRIGYAVRVAVKV